MPQEAEKLLAGQGTDRADYLAQASAAPPKRQTRAQRRRAAARAAEAAAATTDDAPTATTRAPTSRPSAAAPAPTPANDVDLVDVNTANQRALAKLPGMDRGLAKAAVAERTRRGGFASLEDFAGTVRLQPHEIARLRTAAFCSPRPRAARSFGRRVDF